MGAEAQRLRDKINSFRDVVVSSGEVGAEGPALLLSQQREFIALAVASNALQFGSFTLKSGRVSPYFFNAGLVCSGAALRDLGR